MRSFESELRQLGRSLGLLVVLLAGSILLFSLQSWLQSAGGWPLQLTGLICLWSALLIGLTALQERRRIRREHAINATLAEIRRVIGAPARRDDEDCS